MSASHASDRSTGRDVILPAGERVADAHVRLPACAKRSCHCSSSSWWSPPTLCLFPVARERTSATRSALGTGAASGVDAHTLRTMASPSSGAAAAATASDRSARQRKHFVMSLKPGTVDAYKKSHDEIWPEMVAMLKAHGVHNYSISFFEAASQLFSYVEIESQEQWDAIASTEVCQRWWRYMEQFVEMKDGKPVATPLTEVFFLK